MKILLRHVGALGAKKEYVDLPGVPSAGDEIHWAERIVRVHKTIWFPGANDDGLPRADDAVACLYVTEDDDQ